MGERNLQCRRRRPFSCEALIRRQAIVFCVLWPGGAQGSVKCRVRRLKSSLDLGAAM